MAAGFPCRFFILYSKVGFPFKPNICSHKKLLKNIEKITNDDDSNNACSGKNY